MPELAQRRVRLLEATRLLGPDGDPVLDRLTRLAAGITGAPTGLLAVVGEGRQFFKSAFGLPQPWAARREAPLARSFCARVVEANQPLLFGDTRQAPGPLDEGGAQEFDALAYLGVPLVVDGVALGAFGVADGQPRRWTEEQVHQLEDLAAAIAAILQLRLTAWLTEARSATTEVSVEDPGDAGRAPDTETRLVPAREAELRRADQLYRAIVQHLPGGAVFVVDRDLRYVSAEGPILPEMLQRADLGTLVGRRVTDVVLPTNREAVLNAYAAAFRGEQHRHELERAGRFYDLRTVPIYDGADITHVLVSSFDVTERRRDHRFQQGVLGGQRVAGLPHGLRLAPARDALATEHALLETMIAHIDDGVALLDADRRVLLANDRYCEMLGIDRVRARGMSRDEFLGHLVPLLADPETFRAEFAATPTAPMNQEFTFARPQRRVMRRSWTPLRPEEGGGFLVTWHDVTAAHDLLREREQQLLVDPLTGIANRRAADLAMRTEHERMKRTGTPMSIALFDVDHFKRVNDQFGHACGDQVLAAVAGTLKEETRLTDTVARWGGEEFVAVLNVPLDSAKAFCERVRRTIEQLDCSPAGRVTISAGLAELSPHETIADALARADRNLYQAKAFGRNRVRG